MPREFVVSVDIGKMVDYTAIAVAEAIDVPAGEREPVPGAIGQTRGGLVVPIIRERMVRQFHVSHLERLPLGRSYTDQVNDVAALVNREPLRSGRTTLLLDRSGVGAPIADTFEGANLPCQVAPIVIHGGDTARREGAGWSIPKRDLVAATLSLLQQDRLKIAANLPYASVLTQEMTDFEMKISASGHDSYSARSGQHDDLVLALAMIAWYVIEEVPTQFL